MSWRETVERKEEPGHARCDSRYQKPVSPPVEPFTGEQSEQNNQAGKNSDKADQRVNYRVDVQYHGSEIFLELGLFIVSSSGQFAADANERVQGNSMPSPDLCHVLFL